MTPPASTLIQHARIIDPFSGRDETGSLFVTDGRIAPVPDSPPPGCEVIDAAGLVLAPGLWDIHVHLREPGGEDAETIETGSRAAAHGGFTTIVAMPNTRPAIDTPDRVAAVIDAGRAADRARVLTTACITRDRAGRELAPLAELAAAGAVAFTDDGCTVPDTGLMRRALEQARDLDRVIMDHAQDPSYEAQGVMHEGEFSRRHGLPGIPSVAETSIVRRDAELAEETGGAMHIQHITAGETMDILESFRARGVRITGELSPHHLALCDADIDPADANYKMNPPLRSAGDRDRLRRGFLAGIVEVFATDHAPHPAAAKARGWLEGPFGVLGLETAVGMTYSLLVEPGHLPLTTWVAAWTTRPASVLGFPPPRLAPGAPADLVLLDLATEWTVDPDAFLSRSRNTPFGGRTLRGRAVRTWLDGHTTWQND